MALYIWKCSQCSSITRQILPRRPKLAACTENVGCCADCGTAYVPCGGKLAFVTQTTSSTKEVIDNGLMYKPLERDPNVEAQLRERNELTEKADDQLV